MMLRLCLRCPQCKHWQIEWVCVFLSLCECLCVCPQCVCEPCSVCLCLCVPCLFVVCLCLCGLSCVALAHINVAQTLQNTIGSLTWLCHYLHSIFGYSPTVRRVQWSSLFIFCTVCWFLWLAEKKNFALFIVPEIDSKKPTHVWLTISPGARSSFKHSLSLSLSFTCCTCSEDSAALSHFSLF